jgi:hypothetical protein
MKTYTFLNNLNQLLNKWALNQLILLHSCFNRLIVLSLSIILILNNTVLAQNVDKTVGNEAISRLNSNQAEIDLNAQYVATVMNCRQRFLSAQCERQATLTYEKEQYVLKQLQQQKQHDKAQSQAKKRALMHQPLSKPKPLNTVPAPRLQPPSTSRPKLSTKTANQRLSAVKVLPPLLDSTAALSQQPSVAQQRVNAEKFANKQAAIAQRQAQTQQKQAQRHAKDMARQAQGYAVDKP